MLRTTAISEEGAGTPVKLVENHPVQGVDCESATVKFSDGTTFKADLIIGADGVSVSFDRTD